MTIPYFLAKQPDLPIWFIFTSAVVGSMIPNFFILWFLPRLNNWLHDYLAPRINSTVIHLHEVFIKNNRLHYYYAGISLLTVALLGLLFQLKVSSYIWYGTVLIGIPLWGYITFLIAHKAYTAAIEEKSIIHWFYNKVHKEHSEKFYKWGAVALLIVVSIPLPGAGNYTGCILAFLFNIPYWKSIGLIFLGTLVAGGIITALSTGIINGLQLF